MNDIRSEYGTWDLRPCGPVATWFCSNCGREIPFGCAPESLNYCPYCGDPKNVMSDKRTFTVFIRENLTDLKGKARSTVGIRYYYKGKAYGTYIEFDKPKLEENEISEACKELALCYLEGESILLEVMRDAEKT